MDASKGAMTAVAGTGANTYLFAKGSAGGSDMFSGFRVGTDKIALSGYGSNGIAGPPDGNIRQHPRSA